MDYCAVSPLNKKMSNGTFKTKDLIILYGKKILGLKDLSVNWHNRTGWVATNCKFPAPISHKAGKLQITNHLELASCTPYRSSKDGDFIFKACH
jgi:hypothetical protein